MTFVLVTVSLALFVFGQPQAAEFLALLTISVAIIESSNIMRRGLLMSTIMEGKRKR